MSSEPHRPASSSPFREQLLSPGRLRLSLATPESLDCGRLCELTVDLEARPGDSLAHRRGRVRSAVIELSEAMLGRVLATHLSSLTALLPTNLPRPDRLAVRFVGGSERPMLLVIGHFPVSPSQGLWCSLRLPLGPGRQDFRGPRRSSEPLALSMNLLDGEVRVYGSTRTAPSLLALSLALCVGSALLTFRQASTEPAILPSTEYAPGPGMRLLFAHGLREVGVDLLWDTLLQVLPRHGYRAAESQSAALALVEIQSGTLRLTYEGLANSVEFDDDPRGRLTVDGGQIESLLLADRLLIEGDVPAALAAYQIVGKVDSLSMVSRLRRAQVLATVPSLSEETFHLLNGLAVARSEDVGLRLLRLGLQERDRRVEVLAELADLAKEDRHTIEERVLLLLRAARLSDDEAQAVALASEALELGSDGETVPTMMLVSDAASGLLQELSCKLLSDASSGPPPIERGGLEGELALGDRCFVAGELSEAAKHYRLALQQGQVPWTEQAQVHMRLAESAHHVGDYAGEELELGKAVELGGGAAAWSAMAALFQSLGDGVRLGVALYAWSLHEVDEARVDLLRQASRHVGPSLLAAIDEALLSIGADDEQVRERVLRRRKLADDRPGMLSLLIRDMTQSVGSRRWASARLAAEAARLFGDPATEAEAVLVALSSTSSSADEASLRAIGILASEAVGRVPQATVLALRSRLKERGALRSVLRRLDQRLALLASATAEPGTMMMLLRQTAVCLALLDEVAAAASRWLRVAALGDGSVLAESRRLLGALVAGGQHEQARRLVEAELKRCPPEHAAPLRVALGEVLLRSGRPSEALGQLELALLRDDELPAAHALLGQILFGQGQPAERSRALAHLLAAGESPDLSPKEAGECALLAARLLLCDDAGELSELPLATGLPQSGEIARQAERLLLRAIELLDRDPRPLRLLIRHHRAQQQSQRALPLCDALLDVASTAEDRAAALFQKSQLTDDTAQSINLLHESLQHDAGYLPALSALRIRAEVEGDNSAALGWLSREIAASPSDGERAELLLKQAELLHPQQQAELAITTLRKAMQLGSVRAAQRLGELLYSRGELLQAADVAGRAAQSLPKNEQGRQLLIAAEWALRVGDELRAREYLRQATSLGDESAQEAEQRLIVLDGGDDPASRRRTLEGRLSQPAAGLINIEVLRQLLLLCARQADMPAVERYAQALLTQVPLHPLGLTALADCLIAAGRDPDVIFPQLQVFADYPRRATLLKAKAEWLLQKGELAAAERSFADAMVSSERRDERLQLAERLSSLQAERGDHVAAAVTLAQTLPSESEPSIRRDWHLQIARYYEQAGLWVPAAEQLRTLLKEWPGERTALERLYAVALGCGDLREARICLDELVAQSVGPERARWLCRRAELHQSQGAYSDALSDGEVALAGTDDPSLLRALLLLAVQLSDGALIQQATLALQRLHAPLLTASALAGCGLLLHAACPAEQAERLIAATEDSASLVAALSQSVASFRGPLVELDRVIHPVRRLLELRSVQLHQQLAMRAFGPEVDLGAVKLLARLSESDRPQLLPLYLSVLAFIEPSGEAAQRLDGPDDELPTLARFSPSEDRLPQPTDELRPLTTLLGYFARLMAPISDSGSGTTASEGPVQRVMTHQATLFRRLGGDLVSDLAELRSFVGAATALWLPGYEPKTEAERGWLRNLQARALQPGLPPLTTDQAHLLLDPVRHELTAAPQELDRILSSVRELLRRRSLLIAAMEQSDLRPALLALLPSELQDGLPIAVSARLALLSKPPFLTLLGDVQRLLS